MLLCQRPQTPVLYILSAWEVAAPELPQSAKLLQQAAWKHSVPELRVPNPAGPNPGTQWPRKARGNPCWLDARGVPCLSTQKLLS